MKTMPSPAIGSEQDRWYCLTTQPKKERLAASCIETRMGCDAFAPCHYFLRKTPNGKKRFLEAVFPCYIFVRCDIHKHYRQMVSMNGVRGVVRYGEHIPPVESSMIDTLRQELNAFKEDINEIDAGDIVEIVSGPFRSFTARVLSSPDSASRVSCLLEILGRCIEVKIDENDIFVNKPGTGGLLNAVGI
jgi:transcriptional antiterminator RfaH